MTDLLKGQIGLLIRVGILEKDNSVLRDLVAKLEVYVSLLEAELDVTVGFCSVHGLTSGHVKEGERLRAEIAELKKYLSDVTKKEA